MRWVVLDASAAVEIVLPTPVGEALRRRLDDEMPALVVPEHFYVEAAAGLRRCIARGMDSVQVDAALGRLLRLDVQAAGVMPLLEDAWALRRNLTVADAIYVVLARRLGAALLTTDEHLQRAPGLGVPVLGT